MVLSLQRKQQLKNQIDGMWLWRQLPTSKVHPCDMCEKSRNKFYVRFENSESRFMSNALNGRKLQQHWPKVLFVKHARQ